MIWWILVAVIMSAGVIIFSGATQPKIANREQFLNDLAKKVNGQCSPIPDVANGFQIKFSFEGQDFIFEDRESTGFTTSFFKGYLHASTGTKLTLQFIEKEQSHTIRSEIVMASKIEAADPNIGKIVSPSGFDEYKIVSNNVDHANKILGDRKVVSVFRDFRNSDQRTAKSVALKIQDGDVILEFHPTADLNPNLPTLWSDLARIETYLDQVLAVVRAVKKTAVED